MAPYRHLSRTRTCGLLPHRRPPCVRQGTIEAPNATDRLPRPRRNSSTPSTSCRVRRRPPPPPPLPPEEVVPHYLLHFGTREQLRVRMTPAEIVSRHHGGSAISSFLLLRRRRRRRRRHRPLALALSLARCCVRSGGGCGCGRSSGVDVGRNQNRMEDDGVDRKVPIILGTSIALAQKQQLQ